MRSGTPATDNYFVWVSLELQLNTISKMTYLSTLRGLSLADGAEFNERKDVHLVACDEN